MASKDGMFLEEEERRCLIRQLQAQGELSSNGRPTFSHASDGPRQGNDTGCLICVKDDDHNNLMLCEGCNDEYHTYCLDPPLAAVPEDDWFCDNCRAKTTRTATVKDDGFNDTVNALPREYTSRFGEVCFAHGGIGYGYWPSCVFDPRLTEGSARQTAKKNLGKKHIVYFFECQETPFAVLTSNKIVKWHEGLTENYHLGKTARAAGKQRALQFQQALQAAIVEEDKPLHMRLDWNGHAEDQPQLLPIPHKKKPKEATITSSEDHHNVMSPQRGKKKRTKSSKRHGKRKERKRGEKDAPLYCKVMKRGGRNNSKSYSNIGFVKVDSMEYSSFEDVRKAINDELVPDALAEGTNWKFHIATLGPVSMKQESSMGPVIPFLRSGMGGNSTKQGSVDDPIEVHIFEVGDKR
ncbi:PHD and RING finger domain-containing protein 1 [Seminavis robusta]|uniref:PHD and RING finger domain-containing protein 1 n=1 Tax=Seminavis robusta TaxID=568900 RepID=A0A9N8E4N1_9STRA|nr:PHD and RING finger domain-containing protein 1 [Seminavis robusta]|eukprot:Sro646_g180810.1 PHD and RING finger domain-containing protein 1 (408) ;mRNA; r:41870-43327